MSTHQRDTGPSGGQIAVRYWASARAAAGTDNDLIEVTGPISLAEVAAHALARHGSARFHDVLATCSVLVGDRPATTTDPADVTVRPGETVEFLPPFAGG